MNQQNFNVVSDFLLNYGVANPSRVLIQGIAEGSNRISDWLWYADQVETDAERRYCLNRILYINPTNRAALDALKSLNRKPHNVVQRSISESLSGTAMPAFDIFADLLDS